jgi:hypothetical protein
MGEVKIWRFTLTCLTCMDERSKSRALTSLGKMQRLQGHFPSKQERTLGGGINRKVHYQSR